ncbi:MAG: hypothetical protein H9W82_01780 [Lactobacillus sp.]|nr:hypothetical protein [Lactobacillus sp.]
MVYVWGLILFLIILRSRNSNKTNQKQQRWSTILLIICGLLAIGMIFYAYFSVNSYSY